MAAVSMNHAAGPHMQGPGVNARVHNHHPDPWRREVPCMEAPCAPPPCAKPPCPEPARAALPCNQPPCPEPARPAPPCNEPPCAERARRAPPCNQPPCPEPARAEPPCNKPPCPETARAEPPCDKPPCPPRRSPCAGARPSRESAEHRQLRNEREDAWNKHAQKLYDMGLTTGWDWDKLINGNRNLIRPSGPIRPPVIQDTRVRPAYLMA